MRTTVTLESDVEQLLREAMAQGRTSFKKTLNEAVRRGLKGAAAHSERGFVVEARHLVLRSGIDPARLGDVDDEIEIEEYRRKTRGAALEGREV
jgi:hypothetical protein